MLSAVAEHRRLVEDRRVKLLHWNGSGHSFVDSAWSFVISDVSTHEDDREDERDRGRDQQAVVGDRDQQALAADRARDLAARGRRGRGDRDGGALVLISAPAA